MTASGTGGLRDKLEKLCLDRGAVAFGIASMSDVDSLPRIKLRSTVRLLMGTKSARTVDLKKAMPDAKSVVVFAIESTDDWQELGVRIGKEDYVWPGYLPLYSIRRDAVQLLKDEGYRTAYPYEESAPFSFKQIFRLAGMGAFGKNSLIISPKYGPWLRFGYFLTDAELRPDRPFEKDLCGGCELCLDACPANALNPYVVDSEKCLVGVHIRDRIPESSKKLLRKYEPNITPVTHVMCRRCQLVCPYTSARRRRCVIR